MDKILPYYYPTSLVCVDDNNDFLTSLSIHLIDNHACQLFSLPAKAIEFINQTSPNLPLEKRCLSYYQRLSDAESLIHFDLNVLEREIGNPNRYKEISVVIVDFDMPGMNGLELCRQIEDPFIKKILLTGAADEETAISAFNERIIDCFIHKDDPNLAQVLNKAIQDLQYVYFDQVSQSIQTSISLITKSYFQDIAFRESFSALLKNLSIVEYYTVEEPTGFLLSTRDGTLYRLVIQTKEQVEASKQLIEKHGAPYDILIKISSGNYLAYIDDLAGFLDDAEFRWGDHIIPLAPINGQEEECFFALMNNPPIDIDFSTKSLNYDVFICNIKSNKIDNPTFQTKTPRLTV